MYSAVTRDITVSVVPFYLEGRSDPSENHYVWAYRITIDNGSGRDITLEMWDRIPVSRHEDIQIQLIEPNVRLADDQHYITEQRPQGLLKWWLTVPATARDRNPMLVTYGVRIDRAKDVQTTPLPE